MRAYHHFPLSRSRRHLVASFSLILLPLAGLFFFSYVSGIQVNTILTELLISSWRLAIAFIIAIVLAWLAVVCLVRGKTANGTLALFDVLQSLPTFAILPLAVSIFGSGTTTIIFFLVLTIIWPVIFSIVSALKQSERSWREAVLITRIKGLRYIKYYLLPLTFPGIITGAIIGLGEGWEALVATELITKTKSGLGPFFNSFSNNYQITLLGVFMFLLMIFTLNKFIWLPLLEKSHRMLEE